MIGGGPCRVGGGGVIGGGGVGGGGVIGGGGGVGGGGVIGGSCGGMVCGGSGCGEGADVITWVGTGQGSYIQETTYKYVGMGAGEFETVQVGGYKWCICIGGGCGLLLLVGLLLWLLLPGPPPHQHHDQAGVRLQRGLRQLADWLERREEGVLLQPHGSRLPDRTARAYHHSAADHHLSGAAHQR